MFKKFTRLWTYFDQKNKNKFKFILLLILFGAILEMFGLGVIFFTLKILMANETIDSPIRLFGFEFFIPLIDPTNIKRNILIFFLIYFLIKNLTLVTINYFVFRFIADIKLYISNKLFVSYINAGYEYFMSNNTGEITKNLSSSISSFNLHVLIPFGILVTEIFTFLLISFLALYLDFYNSILLILLIVLPSILLFRYTKLKNRNYGLQSQINEGLRIKTINEMVWSIRDIMLYSKKTFFNDKYVNYDQKVTYAVFNNTFITQSNKYYLEVMLITAISFLIWLGKSQMQEIYEKHFSSIKCD